MRLEGQVAIITGAGRGIGRAIALAYAREGAQLVLASRSAGELEETAQEVRSLGAQALVVPTDVVDRDQVDRMVSQVMDQHCTIDVLVNNAGSAGPLGALHEADPDRWVNTLQVNLFGTYYCSRAVLPAMIKQDRGRIVNICAGGAITPYPLFSAYVASKVGIMRIAEVMALELAGSNVRVNCVCPGGVATRMLEGNRDDAEAAGLTELRDYISGVLAGNGESPDVAAELAVFLASDDSGTLSGRVFTSRDDAAMIAARIPEIMASDAYLLRRMELP